MRYFEDYEVGEVLEYGAQRVEKDDILAFARLYDPGVFHLDEEAAKETMYGGLIAPGFLVTALCLKMWYLDAPAASNQGSPGWDEIRWVKPVRPGDVLSVRAEVMEKRALRSRPGIGVIKMRKTVFNQDGDAVMTAVANWFCGIRHPGAASS